MAALRSEPCSSLHFELAEPSPSKHEGRGLSPPAALPELGNNSCFYRSVSLVILHFFPSFHSFKNMKVRVEKYIVGFFLISTLLGGKTKERLINYTTTNYFSA
uniref:Uncharacterized protein n=1 Tax=Micrurus lemniscatus lemniscatus TaxID=129467 RepID=A0A2D4HSK6_MICLE